MQQTLNQTTEIPVPHRLRLGTGRLVRSPAIREPVRKISSLSKGLEAPCILRRLVEEWLGGRVVDGNDLCL
jgi:hypothetical protein